MKKPEWGEEIFFVHPHGLYLEGAQTALPGLRFIVDRPGLHSTIALLEDEDVQQELPPGANILLMKPAPKIEFLARKHEWNLVAVASELNRRFENKLTISTDFAKAGLPVLPFEIVEPRRVSWPEAVAMLGERLVAQTMRGHAGSGSRIVDSFEAWQTLVEEQGGYQTKLTPLTHGETWTLNACVTHYGVLVSRPFLQLQNLPGCGSDNPLTTAGNWHKPISGDLASEIMRHAERFGGVLRHAGYLGWFGLDVLVSGGGIEGFIECNPRLTASAGIFTKLQAEAGQTPMLVLHVLELLGRDYTLDFLAEQEKLNRGFEEYHVVLRNGTGRETTFSPLNPSPKGVNGVRTVSRREGQMVPPGEPYAIRVSNKPFEPYS